MKSVIQEASSLQKAIEQAWEKAGKPKEFTIKIFQESHRNFIGLTTQSAKIALFFGPAVTQRVHQAQQRGTQQHGQRPEGGQQAQLGGQPPRGQSRPPRRRYRPQYRPQQQGQQGPQGQMGPQQQQRPQQTNAPSTHSNQPNNPSNPNR